MRTLLRLSAVCMVALVMALLVAGPTATAQMKKMRVGLVYDVGGKGDCLIRLIVSADARAHACIHRRTDTSHYCNDYQGQQHIGQCNTARLGFGCLCVTWKMAHT